MNDADWVRDAITELNISAQELAVEDALQIRSAIKTKYVRPNSHGPLWEQLGGDASRRRKDGEDISCEYVRDKNIILIVDGRDDFVMFSLSGNDLCRLFDLVYHIEFYLTDADTTYVLCFNDHDMLIGVGSCDTWLEQLDNNWP